MKYSLLNTKIDLLAKFAKFGDRKTFLDSLAQQAEPKFTKEQEDQWYGIKPEPTSPKPISLHDPKTPATPVKPAKLAPAKPVAPAPDLQKQLQEAFGPNYVPPKEEVGK